MLLIFLAGLAAGFVLGLACAVWIVSTAGYEWGLIVHRWQVELLARRYQDEVDRIEAELADLRGASGAGMTDDG